MRRLTKFEKEIAKFLYDKSGQIPITFNSIYRTFASEFQHEIVYRVRHPNDEFAFGEGRVDIFYKEMLVMTHNQMVIWEEKSRQLSQTTRRFFDALNLIFSLEKNGLLYIEKGFFFNTCGYLPNGTNAVFLSASSIGIKKNTETILFNIVGSKGIDEKEFQVLISSTFQLTAAFEIFVENDFRSEDQVMNDEQKENNRISREINTKALKTANKNLWVAVIAVVASAILQPFLTHWLDSSDNEETKHAEAKTDFFRDKQIKQVDHIEYNTKTIRTNTQQKKDSVK